MAPSMIARASATEMSSAGGAGDWAKPACPSPSISAKAKTAGRHESRSMLM